MFRLSTVCRPVATLVVMLLSWTAHAGFYIEPKIDYNLLSMEASGINVDSLQGTTVGARIGYDFSLFVLALEHNQGSLDAEIGLATVSADSSRTGLSFIFTPPVLPLNVLAGYYSASLKTDTTTYKGDGVKLGVMFTMLPFININLDYFNTSYDVSSLKDKGLVLGLSADFSL